MQSTSAESHAIIYKEGFKGREDQPVVFYSQTVITNNMCSVAI